MIDILWIYCSIRLHSMIAIVVRPFQNTSMNQIFSKRLHLQSIHIQRNERDSDLDAMSENS